MSKGDGRYLGVRNDGGGVALPPLSPPPSGGGGVGGAQGGEGGLAASKLLASTNLHGVSRDKFMSIYQGQIQLVAIEYIAHLSLSAAAFSSPEGLSLPCSQLAHPEQEVLICR